MGDQPLLAKSAANARSPRLLMLQGSKSNWKKIVGSVRESVGAGVHGVARLVTFLIGVLGPACGFARSRKSYDCR